ncbi:hypothetical protein MJ579_17150 [Klebsiella pneumoniae]|nr:hypothetical protein MJ579_17150 [Klebsiella pneumoniae]
MAGSIGFVGLGGAPRCVSSLARCTERCQIASALAGAILMVLAGHCVAPADTARKVCPLG